ncbi:MAG TPA: Xaa-Pro peptidase family protein [Microbacteriaceae bacterium]|nr:Xaa-Pro peptidase family protein [Microbacteriaceae bacterium]
MPDIVILGDTIRSAEMRRELPLAMVDPAVYIERDGTRKAWVTGFELERVSGFGTLEAVGLEELGLDALSAQGISHQDAMHRYLVVRACQAAGVTEAVVPRGFPLEAAEAMKEAGIAVRADGASFDRRRRAKTADQIAGIRRAQRACEAAMEAVRAALREDAVTSEDLHAAIAHAFVDAGMIPTPAIASHGPQVASVHDNGSGTILPGEPIVVDIFPMDPASGCFSDMTRTYCIGEAPAELVEYHALCFEALARAKAACGPGVSCKVAFDAAAEVFEHAGQPTLRTKQPNAVLDRGFLHGLGHGVGLEIHEDPYLHTADVPMEPGDVITLEPGCYRPGFGGCRLEDIVLITDDGCEVLTDYRYDMAP